MNSKVFFSIIILIVGLFLAQALVANFASAEGVDWAMLREESQKLEKENQILEREIVALSSLVQVSLSATKLGFSPAKVVYPSFDLPVAMGKKIKN